MINIFINPDDVVKVVVTVAENSSGSLVAWYGSQDVPEHEGDSVTFEACFREPTYKDTATFADSGMELNVDGEVSMNLNVARMNRMTSLLHSWTLKDENNNDVPATIENAERMHPVVAQAMCEGLEQS